VSAAETRRCVSCGALIEHRAPDAKYCERSACRQKAFRKRKRVAGGVAKCTPDRALLARHDIAVKGIAEIDDPRRRAEVLYAVVWPDRWLQETAA
jgi:hypothetical protein